MGQSSCKELFSLILFFSLGFCVLASAQIIENDVYQMAKKEKKVVYLGAPDVRVFQSITTEFAKKFPGIELEMTKMQPAAAIERSLTARAAKRNDIDFIDTPLGYLPILFNRDLVEPYDWSKNLGVDPALALFNGRAVVGWDTDFPIAYNTQTVKQGDIASWEDLTDPRWRGKILLEPRGLAFAVLALKWGEERTEKYIKAIMANNPILITSSTAIIEALAGGQGSIAVGPYGGPVLKYKREGAPVDVALIGPVPAMMETTVMFRDAPHINATRLFISFLTTPVAQDLLYRGQGLGLVHGASLSPVGQLYKDAGLEVIMESTDAAQMQRLVSMAASAIGARR